MTDAPATNELLACPFCGGAHISDRYVRDGRQMFCIGCGASVAPTYHGPSGDTLERAITAWNTRSAAIPSAQGAHAALAQLDSADARERIDLAAQKLTEWFGYAWSGLGDDRVADKGYKPWCWSGSGQKQFQGGKEDVRDIIRTILSTDLLPDASPGNGADDWRDDPSADERWNAGLDFGMKQFCAALDVDPEKVTWDAATETLDGDVNAAICNILRVKFGDDFDGTAPGNGAEKVMEALAEIETIILGGWSNSYDQDFGTKDDDYKFDCILEQVRKAKAALHSTSAAGETTSSDGGDLATFNSIIARKTILQNIWTEHGRALKVSTVNFPAAAQ